jgi:hypothetical protein
MMSGGEGGRGGEGGEGRGGRVKKCFLSLRQTALLSAEGKNPHKHKKKVRCFLEFVRGLVDGLGGRRVVWCWVVDPVTFVSFPISPPFDDQFKFRLSHLSAECPVESLIGHHVTLLKILKIKKCNLKRFKNFGN